MIEYVVTLQLDSKDYVFRYPQLTNVSTIKQVINPNKSQENTTATVTLSNLNGEIDEIMNGADKFVLGRTMIIERNEIVIFTGQISDWPSESVSESKIKADIKMIGMDDPINWETDIEKFPNISDVNLSQYGNILGGTLSDEGATGTGVIKALLVDTNTYLFAWHFCYALIKCYLPDNTDITASCTLVNGIVPSGLTNLDFETWPGAYPTGWSYAETGTSTINKETTVVVSGSNSCRFDVDGSGSAVYIYQTFAGAQQNTDYILRFWHQSDTVAGGTPRWIIAIRSGAGDPWYYWDDANQIWTLTITYNYLPNVTVWTEKIVRFKTPVSNEKSTAQMFFGLYSYTNCAGEKLYWDDTDLRTAYAYISYTSAEEYILANCYGIMNDAGTARIDNPATILDLINDRFGNFTMSGVTDAETIYTDRAYANTAIAITDGMNWGTFLKKFALNFDCFLYPTPDAELQIKVLAWGTETATATIQKTSVDTKSLKRKRDKSNLVTQHRILYWRQYQNNSYERSYTGLDANSGWREIKLDFPLEYHRDEDEARDISQRYIFLYKNPLVWYDFYLPEAEGNSIDLGDVVNLNHKRANGYADNLLCQIFRREYKYGSGAIHFRVLDISAVNLGIIILYADGDLRNYEFVADGDPGERVLL